MSIFKKSKKKTDYKLEKVMVYAKIIDLNTTYMIYNAVKNKRSWRNKKMDCDKEELEATKKMREEKCEFCEEMIFIQQKPDNNYVWIRNPYCPMCGKKLN